MGKIARFTPAWGQPPADLWEALWTTLSGPPGARGASGEGLGETLDQNVLTGPAGGADIDSVDMAASSARGSDAPALP